MESADDRVHLRIRFAGLCLFAPDRAKNLVHVLFPRTGGHSHGGHDGHHVDDHQLLIHWVANGKPVHKPLDGKHLVLEGPNWTDPDFDLKGVFDLREIDPSGECPAHSRGKADPAKAATRMELHAGKSTIINKGAKWRISKTDPKKCYMPTVIDWRVSNVSRGEVDAMLRRWGVFDTLPDADGKTVNLWILHLPEREQKPGKMSSHSEMSGDQHFPAYYSLLVCDKHYDVRPYDAEIVEVLTDPDRPKWPSKDEKGMLVTCMVAKAEVT
jgi:hypothetical protein